MLVEVFLEVRKALIVALGGLIAVWIGRRVDAFRKSFGEFRAGAAVLSSPSFAALPANVAALSSRLEEVEARIKPNGGGSIIDIVRMIRDDLQETRAYQAMSVNASRLMVWRTDDKGACVWASEALLDLVGQTFEEGFAGSNWLNHIKPSKVDEILARWNLAVESKGPFFLQSVYVHADGHEIPVSIRAERLPSGGYVGFVLEREEKESANQH